MQTNAYTTWSHRLAILSFQVNLKEEKYSASVSAVALITLQYIGVDLPEERSADSEIEELRRHANALDSAVTETDTTDDCANRVRDIVEFIQAGPNGYVIRGQRALQQQFNVIVGTILANHEHVRSTEKAHLAIWNRSIEALRCMSRCLGSDCLSADSIAALRIHWDRTLREHR